MADFRPAAVPYDAAAAGYGMSGTVGASGPQGTGTPSTGKPLLGS